MLQAVSVDGERRGESGRRSKASKVLLDKCLRGNDVTQSYAYCQKGPSRITIRINQQTP